MNTNRRSFLKLGIGSLLAALVAPLAKWLPVSGPAAEASIAEASTTINVTASGAYYAGDLLQIGEEVMQVTAVANGVLTVKGLAGMTFLTADAAADNLLSLSYVQAAARARGIDREVFAAFQPDDEDDDYGDWGGHSAKQEGLA